MRCCGQEVIARYCPTCQKPFHPLQELSEYLSGRIDFYRRKVGRCTDEMENADNAAQQDEALARRRQAEGQQRHYTDRLLALTPQVDALFAQQDPQGPGLVIRVNTREFHTILAALRCYQTANLAPGQLVDTHYQWIASNDGCCKPLSNQEVDQLCIRLNTE
jgi:hypothetical protein